MCLRYLFVAHSCPVPGGFEWQAARNSAKNTHTHTHDTRLETKSSTIKQQQKHRRQHGEATVENLRQQGDAHSDARSGRSWQNEWVFLGWPIGLKKESTLISISLSPACSNFIQTQIRPVCHNDTNGRLQRRNGHVQEREVQRVGRGRPGQDTAAVAALLHRWAQGPDRSIAHSQEVVCGLIHNYIRYAVKAYSRAIFW